MPNSVVPSCGIEGKRSPPSATTDFVDLGVYRSAAAHQLQDIRAVLFQLAGADARNRDQRLFVDRQQLGDGDQRVVGEDDVGGHLLLLGDVEPPSLESQ